MDTNVVSFVLRFTCDAPAEGHEAAAPAESWRGSISHVQSDAETRFLSWQEAVAFIARYVAIEPRNP